MSNKLPIILGIEGASLNPEEKQFLKQHPVLGIILFARNIVNAEQVKELNSEIKSILGDDVLIAIDQEGGRVRRLKNEICGDFSYHPAAYSFYHFYENYGLEEAKKHTFKSQKLMADELKKLGFNMNNAPVCDLLFTGAHNIIGDRSFGSDPQIAIELIQQSIDAHKAAGIEPVIKHIPGHGRALLDSHFDLPIVSTDLATLEDTDFKVFKNIKNANYAMTAHIIFECLDATSPATLSPTIIKYIRNQIGFKGHLISDDLNMHALHKQFNESDTIEERLGYLAKRSLNAGCDIILHCNGNLNEMKAIYSAVEEFSNSQ